MQGGGRDGGIWVEFCDRVARPLGVGLSKILKWVRERGRV